ncbi:MAG: hypothetical protein KDK60_00295 [Chlamydiia bacterium]|nr:hypothetical protein [Chlamydiia bacterium]
MKIWLDTIDSKTIALGHQLGIVSGITTNPAIISDSGKTLEEVIDEVLSIQKGPMTVQVTAAHHREIVEQAESLREYSERIIVKIPVTQEGFKAMKALSHLQIPMMATAIFTLEQALLACRVGATYLAPYYSRIPHSLETLEGIVLMLERYGFDARLVVASLQDEEQLDDCLQIGVDGVTLKKELFETLVADQRGTFEALDEFSKAWKKGKPSKLLP